MGSFSIWHWLVVVMLGGIAYALYCLVKLKQIKAGYSAVRATYMNSEYMNSENLKSARKLFFIALGVDMGVLAFLAIGDLWVIGVFKEVQAGEREFTGSFISTLGFLGKFGWLPIVTLIGVGLALVMWLQSCYRYAKESIGATKFQHEGWIGTGWIFPVFNLFKPYQVISEIYKAGAAGYRSDDDWKKESGSRLLLTWWVFWVMAHLIMLVVGKDMMRNSSRDDLTLPQVVSLLDAEVVFFVISLIVSGLWFVVANHLTERLLIRPSLRTVKNIEVGASSIPSPAASPLFASAQVLADLNNHSQSRSAIADPPPSRSTIPAGVGPETPEIGADEEAIYTAIAEEMENGKVRKGLWTKLWTEAEGDEHKVTLAYIKARVNEISAGRQETLRVASEIRAQQEAQSEEDACRTADARKLECYIEKYSDQLKDLESRFSYTPLHFATENNLEEFVRLLLKSGVEKDAADRFGERALDLAKKYRHGNLVELLSAAS